MKKRLIAMCLAVVSACSLAFSGCGEKKIPEGPDYSASTLQYDFYGYSACIDGWNIDGVAYDVEEDYLSVERIKEYKDAWKDNSYVKYSDFTEVNVKICSGCKDMDFDTVTPKYSDNVSVISSFQ